MSLDDSTFVVLDVETTGLSPQFGDRIVEFAALKTRHGEIIDRYETLMNPGREISFAAYMVNGISSEMLASAPKSKDVMSDICGFLEGAYLIGHNIRFDLKFLNNDLELEGYPQLENQPSIDTVKMARGVLPGIGKYSLVNIAYYLGIENKKQHRAMADVETTYHVFNHLISIAKDRGIGELDILLKVFGINKTEKLLTKKKIDLITNAIDSKLSLNLLYSGINSGTTIRKVTPVELEGRGRKTTMVGYCHLRNEERSFRIDRIVSLEKLSQ